MFCWWKRSLYLYKVNKRLLRMQVSIMQTQTEFIARNFIGLNSRQMPGWCHFLPIITCQTQNIKQTGRMMSKFGVREWLALTIDMRAMTWYRVRGIILLVTGWHWITGIIHLPIVVSDLAEVLVALGGNLPLKTVVVVSSVGRAVGRGCVSMSFLEMLIIMPTVLSTLGT